MSRVDPPDYPAWPTARRLLRLWWEQRRLGIRGLVCAFAYTGVSLTIPLLIQRAIDNAVVHHEHALWPYLAAIVLLAALRMAINFTRRYATARIGIRIEARMRELLYQAYLVSRAPSTTATRRGRCSRARRTTSTRSATSSAGASSRACRAC